MRAGVCLELKLGKWAENENGVLCLMDPAKCQLLVSRGDRIYACLPRFRSVKMGNKRKFRVALTL